MISDKAKICTFIHYKVSSFTLKWMYRYKIKWIVTEHSTPPSFASFTQWLKVDLFKVFKLSWCVNLHASSFLPDLCPAALLSLKRSPVQILQDQPSGLSRLPFSLECHKCHPETHHRCCSPPDTDLHSIRYLFRGLGHEAVWYLAKTYKAGVRTEFETTCLNARLFVLKVSLSNIIYRRITSTEAWPFGLD